MPDSLEARRDAIERALHALAGEARRLERIGFETPLARCRAEQGFWTFLAVVHGAAPDETTFDDRPTALAFTERLR